MSSLLFLPRFFLSDIAFISTVICRTLVLHVFAVDWSNPIDVVVTELVHQQLVNITAVCHTSFTEVMETNRQCGTFVKPAQNLHDSINRIRSIVSAIARISNIAVCHGLVVSFSFNRRGVWMPHTNSLWSITTKCTH